MDRTELTRELAGMTDEEFAQITAEARGVGPPDVKTLIERALEPQPDS